MTAQDARAKRRAAATSGRLRRTPSGGWLGRAGSTALAGIWPLVLIGVAWISGPLLQDAGVSTLSRRSMLGFRGDWGLGFRGETERSKPPRSAPAIGAPRNPRHLSLWAVAERCWGFEAIVRHEISRSDAISEHRPGTATDVAIFQEGRYQRLVLTADSAKQQDADQKHPSHFFRMSRPGPAAQSNHSTRHYSLGRICDL